MGGQIRGNYECLTGVIHPIWVPDDLRELLPIVRKDRTDDPFWSKRAILSYVQCGVILNVFDPHTVAPDCNHFELAFLRPWYKTIVESENTLPLVASFDDLLQLESTKGVAKDVLKMLRLLYTDQVMLARWLHVLYHRDGVPDSVFKGYENAENQCGFEQYCIDRSRPLNGEDAFLCPLCGTCTHCVCASSYFRQDFYIESDYAVTLQTKASSQDVNRLRLCVICIRSIEHMNALEHPEDYGAQVDKLSELVKHRHMEYIQAIRTKLQSRGIKDIVHKALNHYLFKNYSNIWSKFSKGG